MHSIAIRADGSPAIGMGHIMRCLALAKEFNRAGCRVCFLCRCAEGTGRIRQEGFEVFELGLSSAPNTPGSAEIELKAVIDRIQKDGVDILVIDTYNVSEDYFLKLRPYVNQLVYVDDMNRFPYPADVVVNGNITGKYMNYKKYYDDGILLLGPEYNLIREEFENLPDRAVNREVREIMVTTGGSDPHGLSVAIIHRLLEDSELRSLKINAVAGNLFTNKDKLRELGRNYNNVVLYENVKFMSEIMLKSDMAISAGGSTLYELCACGTPTLAFIAADNQEFVVEKMDEMGYVESLGRYGELSGDELILRVKALAHNFEKRRSLSKKMQRLVDGKGARRVAGIILGRR
ncbi:MAG: UDP-2,4-diacetamido-2,4,6-trideoxy-beta-L-altropyranose hydrolase [Clostridiales bacterium]|jgi:UDP-2,4-diacetamido-2,4,6-trideoxy-beta-L-altropyranose hydrolase|nr:UDP-2,4-diacetamido-2,4,6-trideoxy-beta-L-altropyranose hydrolase [Eubacteriales bacterium]MDH7566156.1 UDP-2,4-diacetamido-2,4,6-trideoxy-beta-L-altropyranose hydrolase [Clostridiales bacterium]